VGLVAKNTRTGDLVYIFEYENPRKELNKDEIACHLCGGDLIIKSGLIRIKHFAHKPDSPCSCDYERHPESYEHLFFKKLLSIELGKEFKEYLNIKPTLEYPIHEVKRIADIVFEFPNGWLVAHEIQLSKISIEDLEKRTNDYRNAGVEIVWWLGNHADTETNRKWLFENFGECCSLDWESVHRNNPKNS
jgi:competence protein CoiA